MGNGSPIPHVLLKGYVMYSSIAQGDQNRTIWIINWIEETYNKQVIFIVEIVFKKNVYVDVVKLMV